jgi:hypothetical protein
MISKPYYAGSGHLLQLGQDLDPGQEHGEGLEGELVANQVQILLEVFYPLQVDVFLKDLFVQLF